MLNEYFSFSRTEMCPFLPAGPGKVLEIGCAAGGFSENVPNRTEYWGIEPDIVAAEEARSRLDRVLVGTYEDCADQLPEGYFDTIICNDVIEHMTNHDAFLRAVQRHMAPAGLPPGRLHAQCPLYH